MKRSAGILLPIFSLPAKYGIGTLGKEAYEFIDFLVKAGQSYWQILPIGPTSFGDSPYQSFSSFAGNPYFIDLDELVKEELINEQDININWGADNSGIDYGLLYKKRYQVLKKAVVNFKNRIDNDFYDFLKREEYWLADYALFMAIKRNNSHKEELKDEIFFWQVIQYLFFKQWFKLKKYANEKGIKIIGDLPIYVALDSADVFSNPQLFQLDDNYKPIRVAGCPPDFYAKDGQLWGNPLYNWDLMKKDDYLWWRERIKHQLKLFDFLRIDHFRAFAEYFAIDADDLKPINGKWLKGPGIDFFRTIEKYIGKLPLIAEDLGFLNEESINLLKASGYPGMKVLEFAFDGDNNPYLPHNYINNCIVYTGTHDNEPVVSWLANADSKVRKKAIDYMHLNKEEGYHIGFIRTCYESVADVAIIPLQDVLGLGSSARINRPSSITDNWLWRTSNAYKEAASKLNYLVKLYDR